MRSDEAPSGPRTSHSFAQPARTRLEPEGSLAALLAWRASEGPDRGFLYVEEDGPWTFAQLAAAAVRLGRRLDRVQAGDRVALRLGNDERFFPALMAVWSRGAAAVAIHPSATEHDVARIVSAMGVRAVICDPDDPAARICDAQPVTFPRFAAQDGPETATDAAAYSPPITTGPDDEALIMLTSGSTGEPKGVVLTHESAWATLRATVSSFRRDAGPSPLAGVDKAPNLIAAPLSHTSGIIRLLVALYVGRRVALIRKFDARIAKQVVDRHLIDNLTINPTMMRMLLDTLEPDENLGSVLYTSSGTAPLTNALREEFEARFKIPVLQAYGQTETFGAISIESARDVLAGRRRPGSVGRPLPGVIVRLVRPDGSEAEGAQEGEIRVRSRTAMLGYVGTPDANDARDQDGWLCTGDVGWKDDDGYLYITGRIKNIIICGGFNVVPEEVEAALDADPETVESVVVGVPDDRLGEIPVALVRTALTAADVLEAVKPRLASYKRPRRVFIVNEFPRVPNGKVDRPRCRTLALELVADE